MNYYSRSEEREIIEAKHGPEVDDIMDKVADYGRMEREHTMRGIGVPAPMHRTPQKMIDLLDEIEKDLVQLTLRTTK